MKVLMINSVCGIRSTGRICTDLAAQLERRGDEAKIAYGRESVPQDAERISLRIGSSFDVRLHALKARAFDAAGFGSAGATKRLIRQIKEWDPDIIHLHNIHGYYIHIGILFDYLKTCGKKIIWTLHDSWAFTGHSPYCDAARCEKWKTGCSRCPKKDAYPRSATDFSARNWRRKKEIFTSVPGLTIVTPSRWLAGLVRESFLGEYPVEVIPNGIDTAIFHPCESGVRKRYGIEDKTVVLGVSTQWEREKGLYDMLRLSEMLDDSYRVLLVGQIVQPIERVPERMITIPHVDSPSALAEIYSAADVFVNPTYADTYPTVNLEAIACGTPAVTYDTGGSPESACAYGVVTKKGNVAAMAEAIGQIAKGSSPAVGDMDFLDKRIAMERYIEIYCR